MNHSLLDLIGNTPLVPIRHLNPNPDVTILAKLEYMNPGGSVKDRAALFMIEEGERSGELTKDKIVIEATSGNTGIGLAMVCAVKGYRLLLAMSESASIERQKILKARGADILLTPGHLSTDGAIEEVYRLARRQPDRYFVTDQFNNAANWKAHYHGTAVEIWEQTDQRVTAVVATLGTSGTLMGLSRRLKEFSPDIRIVGVEPYMGHKIQGLKNLKESYQPEIFEKDRVDTMVNIEDEEAFETTRQLARQEGLLVGMSSGAAMAAAVRQAAAMDNGVIVVILPDSGERYLSTPLFADQKKPGLTVFHTAMREKTAFVPAADDQVGIYTDGPIAAGRINIGEARRFVFTDLLVRYLQYRGYGVKHVVSITDLDDKTIHGAEAAGKSPAAFADDNIAAFQQDCAALGIRPADAYPRTSEHVDDMVRIVERLVANGCAYEKLKSLYFNISRFDAYGDLSGIDLDKIRVGVTVDLDEYVKDNPKDFTLLKRVRLAELKKGLYTKTRWGNVRPSWALQCAAVAMEHLGESFDLHTGSRALLFPHHENETAIAGALSQKPLARFWLHCGRVLAHCGKGEKIAVDVTVQTLLDHGWSGRQIRFWLLSHHYRKPAVYSAVLLKNTRKCLGRLDACVDGLQQADGRQPYADLDQLIFDIKSGFVAAMDDDLNISAALAAIFKIVRRINRLTRQHELTADQAGRVLDSLAKIDQVLAIFDFAPRRYDRAVQQLLDQREKARQEKNWALADQLRDDLRCRGVTLRDTKVGN